MQVKFHNRPAWFAGLPVVVAATLLLIVSGVVLATDPTVTLDVPNEGFIGEPVTFTVTFDNTNPTQTGYGPYVDLFLPIAGADGTDGMNVETDDGISFNSATYLGVPVNSFVFACPANGSVVHPLTGLVVTCPTTYDAQLVVLELPFGSFTPDQPPAEIEVTADVSNLADLGTPLPISATSGFRFGADALDNPLTDPPIISSPVSTTFTPTLIQLRKDYFGPENETATGPNFPREYEIIVDIASGQTITNLDIIDELAPELQYISLVSATPGTCSATTEPSTTAPQNAPNNRLVVTCSSVTGGSGSDDARVRFRYFVPLNDASGSPVLPADSGDDNLSENQAQAVGDWAPIDPRDAGATDNAVSNPPGPEHTLEDQSIAIQKSVDNLTDGTNSPGDVLEYTLNFQISDFFAFEDIVITDTISDGQRFQASFTPTLSVNGNTYTLSPGALDGSNFDIIDRYTGGTNPQSPVNGETDLIFRVSDEIVTRGQNGQMVGGCVPASGTGGSAPNCDTGSGGYNDGPTTGTLVFRTVIQDQFSDDFPSGDESVDQGDVLSNSVIIDGAVLDVADLQPTGLREDDDSGASISIPIGAVSKSIYAINGSTTFEDNPVRIAAGDTITYRLQYSLPTSDVEALFLEDYLPLPVFNVNFEPITDLDESLAGTIPPPGIATFGPADTFYDYTVNAGSPRIPTVSNDGVSNSVRFFYGDFDDPAETPTNIDILFTVTTRNDPFADQLYLTNQVRAGESSTFQVPEVADAIIQIQLTQPVLNIRKGIAAADATEPVFNPDPPLPAGITVSAPGSACPRLSGGVVNSQNVGDGFGSQIDGIDAGDLVTYAIAIENTGSGLTGAFDIRLRDSLPSGFAIPSGGAGLNLCVTDGTGAVIPFTNIGGGLFDPAGGIELTDPGPTNPPAGALDPGIIAGEVSTTGRNIAIITYDLVATTTVEPNESITNSVTIFNYANEEGGPPFPPPPGDDVDANITDPVIDKTITTTNQSFTADLDVAVGEIVTYQISLTIPESTLTLAQLTDSLDAGLALVAIDSITPSSGDLSTSVTGGFDAVRASATVDPDGGGFTLDFGTLVNSNTQNAVPETITIIYRAVVLNSSAIARGNDRNNSAELSWSEGTVSDSADTVNVVEPTLNVDKAVDQTSGDAGNTVTFSITITNPNITDGATAFDLELTDAIPAGLSYVTGTLACSGSPAPVSCDDTNVAGNTLTLNWDDAGGLPEGGTLTVTFDATIDGTVVPDELITNTAELTWTSLPGDVTTPQSANNPLSVERTGSTSDPGGAENDYTDSDDEDVQVNPVQPVKRLVTTSEAHTSQDTATGVASVAIGEIARFRLELRIPESTVPNLRLVDFLPGGLTFLNDGTATAAFVSNDDADCASNPAPTITSSTLGTAPWACGDETTLNSIVPSYVLPDTAVSTLDSTDAGAYAADNDDNYATGDDVYFKLGSLVNSDSDPGGEFVVIEFNALVDNSTTGSNDDGDTRANTFEARVAANTSEESTPVTLTVVEPEIIDLAKTITTGGPYDGGDLIAFEITFSNSGSTDAFDVALTDSLPDGYVNAQIVDVQSSGVGADCALGVTADATSDIITLQVDQLPTGCAVTVTFTAQIVDTISAGETIENVSALTYTSLPGSNGTTGNATGSDTPGSSGAANGERDGSDVDLNDYFDGDGADITTDTPTITKSGGGDYTLGNIVTFDLLVTLPEGVTEDLVVADILPDGLSYEAHEVLTSGAPLTEPYSGDPDVVTPALASPASIPGGNGEDVILSFGDVATTADNNPNNNAFIVRVYATVVNVLSNQNGATLTNDAELTYTDPDGDDPLNPAPETVTVATDAVDITVVEPILTIAKTATPSTPGLDAGDTVSYQLVVEHHPTSAADAYAVLVTDVAPPNVLITSIDSVVASAGVPGTVTTEITGGGTGLRVPNTTDGTFDLPLGETVTITYTGTLQTAVNPNTTLTNTARVAWASLDSSAPVVFVPAQVRDEGDGTADGNDLYDLDETPAVTDDYENEDTASVTTRDTTGVKSLVATSETHTTGSNLAIGEIGRFRLVLEIPEGTSPNLRLVDLLPSGMQFLNDGTARVAFVSDGSCPTPTVTSSTLGNSPWVCGDETTLSTITPSFTLPDAAISNQDAANEANYGTTNTDTYNSSTDVYFRLGTVTNTDSDADAEYVVVEFNVLIMNTAATNNGGTLNNTFVFRRGEGNTTDRGQSNTVTVTLREPSITNLNYTVTSTGPFDANDPVSYQITFSNSGATTAFDVQVLEAYTAFDNISGVTVTSTGPTNCATGITNNSTSTTLDVVIGQVPAGCAVTITFTADIVDTAVSGQALLSIVDLTYTSLPGPNGTTSNPTGSQTPGVSGANNGERNGSGSVNDYADSNPANLNVSTPAIDKLNLSDTTYTLGEVVTYNLLVTLPEGVTESLVITDFLPDGLAYTGHSIVTTGAPLTAEYNGDADEVTVTRTSPASVPGGSGEDLILAFGNVTTTADNVTTNNAFIVQVSAVVLNELSNQNGVTRNNIARLSYNDPNTDTPVNVDDAAPVTITIVEPVVVVEKSVLSSTTDLDAGDEITYQLVIRHDTVSTADAYSLLMTDIAADDVLITSVDSVVPSAGVPGTVTTEITGGGTGLRVPSTGDGTFDLPLGETVTITYTGTIQIGVEPNASLTNTARVAWASLDASAPVPFQPAQVRDEGDGAPDGTDLYDYTAPVATLDDYENEDTFTVSVAESVPVKTLVATSETHTPTTDVAIGEIARYRLELELPEGTSPNLRLVDLLPSGMQFLDDGTARVAFVSNAGDADCTPVPAASVTSNGTALGTTPWQCGDETTLSSITPTTALPDELVSTTDSTNVANYGPEDDDTFASGTDVFFKLGNVVNSDSDADLEFVVVEFNAVVDNRANSGDGNGNDDGDTLANSFAYRRGSATTDITTSDTVTLTVREPLIDNLAFDVTSTGPFDAGDAVNFSVTFTNTGTTTAFNVAVSEDFTDLTNIRSVTLSGAGDCAVGGQNFSTTSTVSVTLSAVPVGCAVTLNFIADVLNDAPNGLIISNTFDLTYTSLPGPNGTTSNPTGSNTPGASGADTGERDGSNTGKNDYLDSDPAGLTLGTPAIDKLDLSDTQYTIGEVVTYDLLVTLPEGVTESLVITDFLPDGLAYTGHSIVTTGAPLTAEYNGDADEVTVTVTSPGAVPGNSGEDLILAFGNVTTTPDNVTTNNAFIVRVTARVLNILSNQNGVTRDNTARLTYNDPNTDTPVNVDDAAPVTITVVEPILLVAKSVNTTEPAEGWQAGDEIEFAVTFEHAPTSVGTAYDVFFEDFLPPNMEFVTGSANSSGPFAIPGLLLDGDATTGVRVYYNATFDLPPGASLTQYYTVRLTNDIEPGEALTNDARVIWSTLDGSVAEERGEGDGVADGVDLYDYDETPSVENDYELNDDATITTANLFQLDKTASGSYSIGAAVSYTLTLTVFEGTTPGVEIIDTLPAGFAYDAGSLAVTPSDAAAPAFDALNDVAFDTTTGELTIVLGDVVNPPDGGSTLVITYDAIVLYTLDNEEGDEKTNSADVTTSAGQSDLDNQATVQIVEPGIETIKQITSPSPADSVEAADVITYQLTFTSIGSSTAYDVTVEDDLPFTVTYNNDLVCSQGSGSLNGSTLELALGDIAPTNSVTCTYTVTANSDILLGGSYANTADADWSSQPGADNPDERVYDDTTTYVFDGDQDTDTALFLVPFNPTFDKADDRTQATIGDTVNYTLTIGAPLGEINTMVVTDALPTGVRYNGDVAVSGISDPVFVDDSGGSLVIEFNGAQITSSIVTITYSVTVEDDAATQQDDTLINTATLNWLDAEGTPQGGLQDTDSFDIIEPQILTTKDVSPASTAQAGDTLTYTVRFTNIGDSPAYDVTARDTMAPSTTFVGLTPAGECSQNGTTPVSSTVFEESPGLLFLGGQPADSWDIAPGDYIECVYTVTTDSDITLGDTFTNTVDADWSSQDNDDNPDERLYEDLPGITVDGTQDTDTAEFTTSFNLTFSKTNDVDELTIGQRVTYTLTLSAPLGTINDAVVTDVLPAGLILDTTVGNNGVSVSGLSAPLTVGVSSPNTGTTPVTLTIDFGNLVVSADPATITYSAVVANVIDNNDGDTLTNTAQIDAEDLPEPLTDTTTITVLEPQITTTKTITDPTPATDVEAGDEITYQVTFTNTGSSTAYDVTADDLLPAGVVYNNDATCGAAGVSASFSGQTLSYGAWDIGVNDTVTCDYSVTVQPGVVIDGAYTNTVDADWSSLDGDDPGERVYEDGGSPFPLDGDQDEAEATFQIAGLAFTKTDDREFETIGGEITYTLTITGPLGTVNDLVVADTLPAGLIFNSDAVFSGLGSVGTTVSSPNDGTAEVDLEWNFGDITLTQSPATITFTATVANVLANQLGEVRVNTATLDYSNALDEPQPQLSDSAEFTISEPVLLLDLTQSAPADLDGGDTVTYTVTISHDGTSTWDAYNVIFSNPIPAGIDPSSISIGVDATGTAIAPPVTSNGTTIASAPFNLPNDGSTVTITINATVLGSVTPGQTITNVSSLVWDTQPGDDPQERSEGDDVADGEELLTTPAVALNDYELQESETLTITTLAGITKTIAATSESSTADSAVTIGEVVTYRLTIDLPSATITPLTITDSLPTGLAYVGGSVEVVSAPPGTGFASYTVTPAGSGASGEDLQIIFSSVGITDGSQDLVIEYDVLVLDETDNIGLPPAQTALDNSATVQLATQDPLPPDTTTITVVEPQLQVTKAFDPQSASINGLVLVRLQVENTGTSDAFDVRIEDPVDNTLFSQITEVTTPAGFAYSASVSGATTTIAYQGGSIPVGETREFVFRVRLTGAVEAGQEIPNTATVTEYSTLPGEDPNERDLPPVANDDTLVVAAPDLEVTKTHQGNFAVGEQGAFTITVRNLGPGFVTEPVTLTDTLPAELDFVSAQGTNWTCGYDAGTLTCTYPDPVAPNTTLPVVTLRVIPNTTVGQPFINTAVVSTPGEDPDALDNNADDDQVTVDPEPLPDLVIDKRHTGSFAVGQTSVFQLEVTNIGTAPAPGPIVVTDPIPAALDYVAASGTGWTCDENPANTITCTNQNALGPGASLPVLSVQVVPQTTTGSPFLNTATVSGPNAVESNTDNNDDDDPVQVIAGPSPDLAIRKSHSGNFVLNVEGAFDLEVENVGNAATTGAVTVTDTLPAGLGFVSGGGTDWTCATDSGVPETITCDYSGPALNPGDDTAFEIVVLPTTVSGSPFTNTAVVDTPGDTNDDNDDDDDTVVVTETSALDLTIDKSHAGNFVLGADGEFTLTVTNVGTGDTTGPISVVDALPAELDFVSASGTDWTCSSDGGTPPTVTCDYAGGDLPLEPGAGLPDITLVVQPNTADGDPFVNTATVSTDGDANPANNTDEDPVSVDATAGPDLTIDKAHATSFVLDQEGEFTLTIRNVGSAETNGDVVVTDTVPDSLEVQSVSGVDWDCSASSGQDVSCAYTGGDLPLGPGAGLPPITLVVIPREAGGFVNTAVVSTDGDDGNETNNEDDDPVNVDAEPRPDLAINKRHSGNWSVGAEHDYVLEVENVGSAATTGVITVTDELPFQLDFVSADGDDWDCDYDQDSRTVTCTTDETIGPGGDLPDITLRVRPNTTGTFTNTAEVDTEGDTNDDNDEDDDRTVVVGSPELDLAIDKSRTRDFQVGRQESYIILVTNVGGAPTTGGITVTDNLPAGMTYVPGTDPNWTCSAAGQLVTCDYAGADLPLDPGEDLPPLTLTVDVAAPPQGVFVNTATVATPGDNNPENDSDSDTTTTNAADVYDPPSVIKTVNDDGYPELEWQMVIINPNDVPVRTFVVDDIPENTGYVAGSLVCLPEGATTVERCEYNASLDRVEYEGVIGPQTQIVIVFRTNVPEDMREARNTVEVFWDGDGDEDVDDNISAGQEPLTDAAEWTLAEDDDDDGEPGAAIIAGQLNVQKSVFPPFVAAGDTATWTITVTNATETPLTAVALQDAVPDTLIIQAVESTSGSARWSAQAVAFEQAALEPGAAATITITTRVRDDITLPDAIINRACAVAQENNTPVCDDAELLNTTELPATGETPLSPVRGLLPAVGLAALGVAALWRARRLRGRS